MGKQAIDDDMNATGQMLAALLGWPQGTFASKITLEGGKLHRHPRGRWRARDAVARHALHRHRRPAPERAALREPSEHHEGAQEADRDASSRTTLGVDPAPRLKTVKVAEPPRRQAGVKVGSVAELVQKLRTEAKVI